MFVPALLGLGTPAWDYGARGALFGLTRGTGRAEIVRAVLEGIAHRGADLVEAAEADAGIAIPTLRVDGGMTDNPTFVQALADATQRPVEISPVREATTLGAALLAGLAVGHHESVDDLARTWNPACRVEPERRLDREHWRDAVAARPALDPRALRHRLLSATRPARRAVGALGRASWRATACRAPRNRAPTSAAARPGVDTPGWATASRPRRPRRTSARHRHPLRVLRAFLHRS